MEMKPDLGALLNMAGVVRKLRDMSLVGTEAEERALFDRLNARQLAAMVTVFRFTWKTGEGMTLKKFADHLGMQGAAASLLVSGMVRSRLLKRVVDSKNRRYVRISLSGKGEKVLQAVMPQMECVSEELLSRLSAEEREAFRRIAGKLYGFCFPEEETAGKKGVV